MESKDLRNYTKLNVYLIRSCDVLKHKFKYEWKLKYCEEWNHNSSQQMINILGNDYIKRLGSIQRSYVINGNIDEWDITLLKDLLLNKTLFTLKTTDSKIIKELVTIRNKTAHYGSKTMSDNEFIAYRQQIYEILIALGDNEEELKKLEFDESIAGIEFSSDDVINDENITGAKTLKELGNQEFSRENYENAIKHYTNAIILSGLPKTDRAILFCNRSICYMKLKYFKNAEKDAKETVKLWPQWWKGYYRLAQIYHSINDYQYLLKAEKCLIQAQSHENKEEITTLLNQVRLKIGPMERYDFIDPKNNITSTEELSDYYNKITGLDMNGMKEVLKGIEKTIKDDKSPANKIFDDVMRGKRYLEGVDGYPLDYEKALECFSKAANRGSALGMYYLSYMFRDGKGVKQDFKLTMKYLLKAAQQSPYIYENNFKHPNIGVAEAEHTLGGCYETGLCIEKDILEAINWYKKAVDHESGDAANNLGLIYMNGKDLIGKDLDKAEQLFKFAANKGVAVSMLNIALLYNKKDEPEMALEWCKRLRNKGYDYPQISGIESAANQRLIILQKTFKDVCESGNDEENSEISLKQKIKQKLSKKFPKETNFLREYEELRNENKPIPVEILTNRELPEFKEQYDIETLQKYVNSGKLYAKKLLIAKMYFLESFKAFISIKDHNNPSSDDLKNFIKNLSLCAQNEFIVALVGKPMVDLVKLALNKKLSYDEDVRICYSVMNIKDFNANIIFLNECVKIYPKNAHFLYMRGAMYAFREEFEKSLRNYNEALKLAPNDEELLYSKAGAMSRLGTTDYQPIIDAYNKFISIAPEDHRQIPQCYYMMAVCSSDNKEYDSKRLLKEIQKYYQLGLKAEEKQLSFFLPYDSQTKRQIEIILQLGNKETIPISPQNIEVKNKHLTDPYRIELIKNHREYIYALKINYSDKNIYITHKPPKIQKSAKSLAGLKSICLRDMDPTTDKIYDKFIIDFKVIDIVGDDGSSLVLVVEDNNKDVQRCYIYNSPLLNDIKSANKLYGAGTQFSVINPYFRITADMKPAIRIDDIKSIVMRDFIKDMCRYCCESNATNHCIRCKTAMYCSRECQVNDYKQNSHKLICCKV